MIPYDDLVAALSAWRARQGLPVNTLGAKQGSGPTAAPTPGSGPTAKPSSGGTKAPPPLEMHDEEVGDAEMLEEHYENEGSDFAMNFNAGGGGGEGEATSIGGAPERPTDENMGGRGGNGRDNW
jgi:hypothetical protein